VGNFQINTGTGAFTYLPDPAYCKPGPDGTVIGQFQAGKPIRQGPERVLLGWPVLSYQEWDELRTRWNNNKTAATACTIPSLEAGTPDPDTYRTETCWVHEPSVGEQRDTLMYNVELRLTID